MVQGWVEAKQGTKMIGLKKLCVALRRCSTPQGVVGQDAMSPACRITSKLIPGTLTSIRCQLI